MTAKLTASADGSKVLIGTAAEDALEIDANAKTVKALSPYTLAGNGPAFAARRTTIQNVTSGADAVILFPTEDFDTNAAYNPASGRFQPTVAGYYQVNATARLSSDATITSSALTLFKNGSANMGSSVATSGSISHAVSNVIYMNGTTDYIEAVATITGTGPLYVEASATFPAIFSAFLARTA